MRWYIIPKGTEGKVLFVNKDGTVPDQDVREWKTREEIGTADLVFDPVVYHNRPEDLLPWQAIYARLGYCGVYRESDSGQGYVFVTRYSNTKVY